MAVSRCIACLEKTMRTICGVFTCDITSSSTMPRAIFSLSFKRHTFFWSIIKIDTKYLILVSLLSIFVATSKPAFRSCVLIYIYKYIYCQLILCSQIMLRISLIQLNSRRFNWKILHAFNLYIYIYRESWVSLYALN